MWYHVPKQMNPMLRIVHSSEVYFLIILRLYHKTSGSKKK